MVNALFATTSGLIGFSLRTVHEKGARNEFLSPVDQLRAATFTAS
jgi:hypothetical protein